jgi:hypothetical protein
MYKYNNNVLVVAQIAPPQILPVFLGLRGQTAALFL